MFDFPKLHIPPSLYASYLMPVDLIGADVSEINQRAEDGLFPSFDCVVPAVMFAFLFGILRKFLQPFVFAPFAMYSMNLRRSDYEPNANIDKAVSSKIRDKAKLMTSIKDYCKLSNSAQNEVVRYVTARNRNRAIDSKVTKFCEALWRFVFYSVFCVVGYYVLFVPKSQPWILNTKDHWTNFVQFTWVGSPVMAYYCYAQLGCYIHQLLWTEVSRSDAWEMILHHVITIFLILFSFLANYTRIGCSILLVHDLADIFLESAKMFNYVAKNNKYLPQTQQICDFLFVIFVLVFAFTRLYVYPRYLVSSLMYDAPEVYGGVWPGWYIYMVLLCGLQGLHIFWFALILRMVYRLFGAGKVAGDVRSDDEFDEMLDDEPSAKSSSSSESGAMSKQKKFPAAVSPSKSKKA